MAEFAEFSWGGVTFPLPAQPAGTPLLEVCDPALFAILQYLKTCINFYVGAALVGAAAGMPKDQPIERAVAQVLPTEPLRTASHTTYRFPLLCGWRVSAPYENRTTVWRRRRTKLRVLYILPPLDADSLVRINPILTAIESVVDARLTQAFDPNYRQGQTVFTANGISRARLMESIRGHSELAEGIDFDTLILDIEMDEQQDPHVSGAPHLQSDLDIMNAADPENPVDHRVDVRSGSTTP
jgi:hypothetical protein